MDALISQAVWWLPVILLALVAWMRSGAMPDWKWLAAAIGIFAVYTAAVLWLPLIDGFPTIEGAQFNWTGKIAAIAATIAMTGVLLALLDRTPNASS